MMSTNSRHYLSYLYHPTAGNVYAVCNSQTSPPWCTCFIKSTCLPREPTQVEGVHRTGPESVEPGHSWPLLNRTKTGSRGLFTIGQKQREKKTRRADPVKYTNVVVRLSLLTHRACIYCLTETYCLPGRVRKWWCR